MTLTQWANKHKRWIHEVPSSLGQCVYVVSAFEAGRELWKLSDYIVSTVSAGVVWLIKI